MKFFVRTFQIFVLFSCVFCNISLFADEVVTTKPGDVDAFYGLRISGVVSPSFSYRYRDSSSGISSNSPSTTAGFSLPWTLLMVEKEFSETGIKAEFWGEVLRASDFSNGTRIDGGTKSNPLTLGIRRALIKKEWVFDSWKMTLSGGIQELPHTYTQWQRYWNWRYIDRAPLESMGFANSPADAGVFLKVRNQEFSAEAGVVNGEGYRELQNTNSPGYDVASRISYEPTILEKYKLGFHVFGRSGNALGQSGTECRESVTTCLPTDGNPTTLLQRDNRFNRNESLGSEWNFVFSEYINFAVGGFVRRSSRGKIFDLYKPGSSFTDQKDLVGKGHYTWLSLGNETWKILLRYESGTGRAGSVLTNFTNETGIEPYFSQNTVGSYAPSVQVNSPPAYSSREYYRRVGTFLEYSYAPNIRFAFGGYLTRNFDANGRNEKSYVDQFGLVRTQTEYLSQFASGVPRGITEFTAVDRTFFIRTTFEF